MELGYALSSEEPPPLRIVQHAARAAELAHEARAVNDVEG
jgi:hypothetical protein